MTANERKTVLITGASAGIGEALAKEFARHQFDCILVARRLDKLQTVADSLEQAYKIKARCLSMDLADPEAPERIFRQVQSWGIEVDALVNNAGFGLKTKFCESSWYEHQSEIQVMITALTHLCHLFMPGMKKKKWGRILNVSSLAVFSPPLVGNIYSATKCYVNAMSQALDLEGKPHGVYCSALCPGFTYSEFHDAMGVRDEVNRLPTFMWMDSEQVAKLGYSQVMAGKPVLVTGKVNRLLATLMKFFPISLMYRLGKSSDLMLEEQKT